MGEGTLRASSVPHIALLIQQTLTESQVCSRPCCLFLDTGVPLGQLRIQGHRNCPPDSTLPVRGFRRMASQDQDWESLLFSFPCWRECHQTELKVEWTIPRWDLRANHAHFLHSNAGEILTYKNNGKGGSQGLRAAQRVCGMTNPLPDHH